MVKVSVIIPVYNYARYLVDAFQSIVFDIDDLEIVIVNDGSTDDTSDVVNEICRPFRYSEKKIKYVLLRENSGVSVARNKGLAESTGRYVTFLDADDMRVPGSLYLQQQYLDTHEKLDVVYGDALEVRGDMKYHDVLVKFKKLRIHPAKVNPQTVMYRRSVFERFGGWYEGLRSGEDKEMSMRLGVHPDSPFKFVKSKKLKTPIAFYRKHPLEKHKLRKANTEWDKHVKKVQKKRIKDIFRYGITKDNTCFPI